MTTQPNPGFPADTAPDRPVPDGVYDVTQDPDYDPEPSDSEDDQ